MVLKRLLGLGTDPKKSGSFCVPPGQRVYAVGDIHGRLDLLQQLLGLIAEDEAARGPSDTCLVFLGDLVDRGPDSRGVIEYLIGLSGGGANARFLMGNHDEVFLKAATGDVKAMRFFTKIGGKETILSYGVSTEEYHSADYDELTQSLGRQVPESHKAFLGSFENYAEIGDYLFVHAGIRPGVDLAEQTLTDLRWIRREFLHNRSNHGRLVVHGHSISDAPDVRRNRIGIDTGAFASGRLTALGLEGSERWFLSAEGDADPRWDRMTD